MIKRTYFCDICNKQQIEPNKNIFAIEEISTINPGVFEFKTEYYNFSDKDKLICRHCLKSLHEEYEALIKQCYFVVR